MTFRIRTRIAFAITNALDVVYYYTPERFDNRVRKLYYKSIDWSEKLGREDYEPVISLHENRVYDRLADSLVTPERFSSGFLGWRIDELLRERNTRITSWMRFQALHQNDDLIEGGYEVGY